MKNTVLLVVLLIVLIGGLVGYKWYQADKAEKAKIAAIEAEKKKEAAEEARKAKEKEEQIAKAKAAEEAKAKKEKELAAAKAKAEAEAKAKEEAEAAKMADPKYKLGVIEKQYAKARKIYLPMRNEIKKLSFAIKSKVQYQNFDSSTKHQAKSILNQIKKLESSQATIKQQAIKAKNDYNKARTAISYSGSKKSDKYDYWYYKDRPNKKYPISTLKNRTKGRKIGYVKKKASNKDAAIAAKVKKYNGFVSEYKKIDAEIASKKVELKNLDTEFDSKMNQKLSEMVRKAKPFANRYYKLKEERKALRKELQEADADDEDDKDDLNEVAKK